MVCEAVIVCLDGIVWDKDLRLGDEVYKTLSRAELIPPDQRFSRNNHYLDEIGSGVSGMSTSSSLVLDAVHQAAQRCVDAQNEDITEKLRDYGKSGLQLVAMSSAPDFAVEAATDAYLESTGISFDRLLASTYFTHRGDYTGQYTRLRKVEAVSDFLARVGLHKASTSLINGSSDVDWALPNSERVVLVNAGSGLMRRARTRNSESRSGAKLSLYETKKQT